MAWTAASLWQSTRKVSPSRSSYSSSKARQVTNVVPYVPQRSVLFQLEHQGMTVRALHQVNLMFSGLDIRDKDPHSVSYMQILYRGTPFWVEKPDLHKTPFVCRCTCPDFYFTFAYWNWMQKALFGPKPRAYRAIGGGRPRNPGKYPGFCKHVNNSLLLMQTNRWVK